MRDRVPDMEYFFCDTGAELLETYEYLQRLEVVLGKKIAYLNPGRDFDHFLMVFGGALPSPQMRWCTKNMKIKPLEAWLGDDPAMSYVAIRADEKREGYVSTKPNIRSVFPFKEDGVDHAGVLRILENAGVGLPSYYSWRTRSGCYFCFFQRKAEWVGLAENHPDLFERAVAYENKERYEDKAMQGRNYTWSQGESLPELLARKEEIMARHAAAIERHRMIRRDIPLADVLASALDDDDDTPPCEVCNF